MAALYEAAAYIIGMIVFIVILQYNTITSTSEQVTMLVENSTVVYVSNLIIYVAFGIALIVLTLALYDRLRNTFDGVNQTAAVLGFIWAGLVIASGMISNYAIAILVDLSAVEPAQATAFWAPVDVVVEGLGGGNEIVGGLWTLLISYIALRAGVFSKILNFLGIVVGLAGILSAVPAFGEIGGAIFGLAQIPWFAWIGIELIRGSNQVHNQPVSPRVEAEAKVDALADT